MAPKLSLDVWTLELRKDCEEQNKLLAFNALGDFVIKLLWERGIDPSINAIVDSNQHTASNPE